jgi:hypothetical protein
VFCTVLPSQVLLGFGIDCYQHPYFQLWWGHLEVINPEILFSMWYNSK